MTAASWKNAVNGDWSTQGDWSNNVIPGSTTDVTIGVAGAYYVTVESPEAAHSITLSDASGTLVVDATLSLTTTLAVDGATLDLLSSGIIQGGTINDSGSGLVAQSGTLDGVTYRGVLTLAGYDQSLYVEGGLTLETEAGGQPGSIDLSGASYSGISVLDSETLDNATLNFGGGYYDSLSTGTGSDSGNTLTLGGGFTIDVSGGTDYLGFQEWAYYTDDAGDTLINAGLINISAGSLNIDYGTFDNTGSVNIDGGALNLYGTTFANAGMLTVSDATLTDAGSLINDGTILLDPSTATLAALTGTGEVVVGAGSTLEVQGTVASGETIGFAAHAGWLDLSPPEFSGEIVGFVSGDTIDLTGVTDATSAGIVNGDTLQIERSGNPAIDLSLDPSQNYAGVLFSIGTDGTPNEYDTVTTDLACFAAGTLLDTPDGPVAVQALRPGDRVLTASGEARAARWIGWRRIDLRRHPNPGAALPVRILAGALAPGEPRRDLLLSPDHALLINGGLIPVRLLLNGATIRQEDECPSVTYFHVELDSHDILLAEGLAAESYLDTGNRGMFENAGLPLTLHPDFAAHNDQARREAESCAPFIADPGRVEPVWQALAGRAGALGHVLPVAATTNDPALRVERDCRRLKPVVVSDGRHVFVLPRGAGPIRLVSRATPPNVLRPWLDDRRLLGVMVRRLTLRHGNDADAIPLDHPDLRDGWWGLEHDGRRHVRWTNGNAELPLRVDGPAILEVEFGALFGYVVTERDSLPKRIAPTALRA